MGQDRRAEVGKSWDLYGDNKQTNVRGQKEELAEPKNKLCFEK